MNEEEVRNILGKLVATKKLRDKHFVETCFAKGSFVEHHLGKILSECGGKWNDKIAREYINSLAAEEDMREFCDYLAEEK